MEGMRKERKGKFYERIGGKNEKCREKNNKGKKEKTKTKKVKSKIIRQADIIFMFVASFLFFIIFRSYPPARFFSFLFLFVVIIQQHPIRRR